MRTGRVLVAEDNEANRLLALKQLEKLGVKAEAVGDGEEAVAAVAGNAFDLVFMDRNMPRLDGFAATKRIRENEASSGVRTVIVAMTAGAMHGDRAACLAAGMDDYLCKPVMMSDLQEMVDRWLPSEQAADETPLGEGAAGRPAGDAGAAVEAATFEALRSSLGDDEFVASFVDTFLSQLSVRLETMDASAAADDGPGLRFVAHTLKSTSAMLGAARLARLCADLEASADQPDERDRLVLATRLEAERVQEELGPWRDRRRAVA